MVPKLYALSLFSQASNSTRFGCWVSKRRLRLYFFGTETTLRQTKHSAFEFTTVNKYLFAVTPQEKNIGGQNDDIFYDTIRDSDKHLLETDDMNCTSFDNL